MTTLAPIPVDDSLARPEIRDPRLEPIRAKVERGERLSLADG
ncbi:MAG: hypothetical protein ACF8Q5_10260 [Phycisphaerales bacterium JB040]